jgi:hypothetical protein
LFYEIDDDGNTRIAHRAMFALQEGLGYAPRRLFLRQHEMSRLAVIGLWLSLPFTPDASRTVAMLAAMRKVGAPWSGQAKALSQKYQEPLK